MLRLFVFYAVLIGTAAYAARRGGAPERRMAALFLVAAAASHAVVMVHGSNYVVVDLLRLTIDLFLLVAMAWIMAKADRFWPIYCSAFQVLAVATHGVRAFDPLIIPPVYYRATAWLAYPTLLILVVGVHRHRRRELIHGAEHDWTTDRHAAQRPDPTRTTEPRRDVEPPAGAPPR